MKQPSLHEGLKKKRRFRHYALNVLAIAGTIGIMVPISSSVFSIYASKQAENNWRKSIEKAAHSKRSKTLSSWNQTLTVNGKGFSPNSEVAVDLDDKPVAKGQADAQGAIQIRFKVPVNTLQGIHTVKMRGITPDGTPLILTANVTVGFTAAQTNIPLSKDDEIAFLSIDAIGVKTGVREGASWLNLVKGAVHVAGTSALGQPGTTLISGHRTTYAAPFGNLDRLKPGDLIKLYTKDSLYVYKVTGNRVVSPTNMEDVQPVGPPRLILSTCEPKYSAASRLLIIAELKEAYAF